MFHCIVTGHRRRSNTAQKLERMKKERRSQRKVKNIPWRDTSNGYNSKTKNITNLLVFAKKSLKVRKERIMRSCKPILSTFHRWVNSYENHRLWFAP